MQVAKKKEKGNLDARLDDIYFEIAKKDMVKGALDDEKVAQESKSRKVKIAQEQMKQHQEKLDREKLERQVCLEVFLTSKTVLEEGKRIAKADEDYKKQQKDSESKKWAYALSLRQQLSDMKEEAKEHKEQVRLQELEHDKKIQSWVTRKSRQNQLKKELEQRWFKYGFGLQLISLVKV